MILPVNKLFYFENQQHLMRINAKEVRKFVLDASANYLFFVPLYIILNTVTIFFGLPYWNLETIVIYALTAIFGSFFLGGVYGRVLDYWRKKLNYK
jgi:hypothetical protein